MITEPTEVLQQLNPFADFTELQLAYIRSNAKQFLVPPRKILLKLGAEHTNIFLLLEGELKLTAADGKEGIISSDSDSAKNPIAQLRPSRYQVSSLSEVKIIVLSEDVLNQAIAMEDAEEIDIGAISVDEMDDHNNDAYEKILFDILSLLHTDKLILPSLPDIALKIRHAAESEDCDADTIADIINMDQSIVAKILKTANSVIYNTSGKKIESSKAAYMRMGSKTVVNLVISFAMKELFNSDSPIIKNKMKSVWQHSVKVAAISSVLARLTPGFDPEKALLAGLLHNIGAVAVLNNLGENQSIAEDPEIIDNILFSLQSEVGETLLQKWDFPDDIINVVKHSTDWEYDEDENAHYSDIINIAQLHAYIGTCYQGRLPNLDEVPAFHKLALGQLTPDLSLQILEKSQDEINETISRFN